MDDDDTEFYFIFHPVFKKDDAFFEDDIHFFQYDFLRQDKENVQTNPNTQPLCTCQTRGKYIIVLVGDFYLHCNVARVVAATSASTIFFVPLGIMLRTAE